MERMALDTYLNCLPIPRVIGSLKDLHDFRGPDGNASASGTSALGMLGGLVSDAAGNLYGVTFAGGDNPNCSDCGVIFKLTDNSGIWTETVLHRFRGWDGANPDAALMMDATGNLYGTTTSGGTAGFGVVFELSFPSGRPALRVLHSFTNAGGDGAYPQSALIMDASGNLYGATTSGGGYIHCSVEMDQGCGSAFKLSRLGQQWKESLLHGFSGGNDGAFPSGLVLDADGNLYGDAGSGGNWQAGLIFEIRP